MTTTSRPFWAKRRPFQTEPGMATKETIPEAIPDSGRTKDVYVNPALICSAESTNTRLHYAELMSEVQKPQRVALMGISE